MKATASVKSVTTKQALIEGGLSLMLEHGYSNTGIVEVLMHVGVPKGSFYHHFESKEQFGCEIISYFEQKYSDKLNSLLATEGNPVKKLQKFFTDSRNEFVNADYRSGCLIGNLSQELADHNEALRQALLKVMTSWKDIFAKCIREAQEEGLISRTMSSKKLSELLLLGWEGALLRAKLTKSSEPIDVFIETMFKVVLKP